MTVEPSTTIMLIDLSVEPARQAEFDSFYHDFYIPEFVRAVPEVSTALRYAQTNAGADSGKAHFLTIYELVSDDCMDSIEAAIARSAHREASDQFKLWKQSGLTYFDRAFYHQIHKRTRQSEDTGWRSQSLCTWQWSCPPEASMAQLVSDASNLADQHMDKSQSIIATHTYIRLGSDERNLLTVFDLSDEATANELQGISPDGTHVMSFEQIYSCLDRSSIAKS